ncbi:MAG: hypothetical protein B0D92_00105 [Spirochaeta sp. LUC14_002_19_P3]|nr:MAG: hypothetical protein B0D92_00105 [Spirochaeta sp. LUC14_002_19_P3]
MTFDDFGFDKRILRGIKDAGFLTPMPVQSQCFNLLIKARRDVYAQSQTGTGKTAAFLLGIFQLIATEERYRGAKTLVVVPTRELAVQIEREGILLGKYLDLRIGCVFGGVSYDKQERLLQHGPDVLIGTPGRLLDFSKRNVLDFKDFQFLVIDEADRLFDMGFLPDLRKMLNQMRPPEERTTLLFSATMNNRVGNLAWEYMNDPGEIIIEPEKVTVDTVSQELYHVGKDEKMKLLLGLLKRDNPENAVIFTNTRHRAWEVAKRLEVNGYQVQSLMGDMPQSKRMKIVDEVKKGHHKFLVATDVAARGLHFDDLALVINYDVPQEAESYVHRIGRTARAGRHGKTITLACEEFVYGLGPIEKLIGHKIPVSWADETLFLQDKSVGMNFSPRDRHRDINSNSRTEKGKGKRKDSRSYGRKPFQPQPNPITGKAAIDPRMAKIQSAVTLVSGGKLDDISIKASKRPSPPRYEQKRTQKDLPAGKEKREKPEKTAKPKKIAKTTKPAKPAKTEKSFSKRISANTSIDDRLAYYRSKYGDDFQADNTNRGKSEKSKTDRKTAKSQKKGLLNRFFGKED